MSDEEREELTDEEANAEAQRIREEMFEAVQRVCGADRRAPEGMALIGFASVAEWIAPNGERYLTRLDVAADGTRLASWQRQGYFFNALHQEGEWGAL